MLPAGPGTDAGGAPPPCPLPRPLLLGSPPSWPLPTSVSPWGQQLTSVTRPVVGVALGVPRKDPGLLRAATGQERHLPTCQRAHIPAANIPELDPGSPSTASQETSSCRAEHKDGQTRTGGGGFFPQCVSAGRWDCGPVRPVHSLSYTRGEKGKG